MLIVEQSQPLKIRGAKKYGQSVVDFKLSLRLTTLYLFSCLLKNACLQDMLCTLLPTDAGIPHIWQMEVARDRVVTYKKKDG